MGYIVQYKHEITESAMRGRSQVIRVNRVDEYYEGESEIARETVKDSSNKMGVREGENGEVP